MKKKPLLLRALAFSSTELEALLGCAIKIMHADNRVRLEEECIINLFPSLLSIAKNDAVGELKSEWRKKLIAASYAIKTDGTGSENNISYVRTHITDFTKRSTSLVILFLIAGSDKHIDAREISFIVNKIAKPWNYTVTELIDILTEESEKIFIPETIINVLKLLQK